MDWFYAKDGRQLGPVSESELGQLLRTGAITADSLVWHDGMAEWLPYRTVTGMPPVPRSVEYGGFWIRFWAYCVDGILIGMIRALLVAPMALSLISRPFSWDSAWDGAQIEVSSLVVGLAYFAFFWTRYGATPGKMIFRLRVVTPAGGPISLAQAIGRYFATILSGLILCIGFMMAGWDEQKRALHDRLAETRVVREPEGTRY